LAVGLSRRRQVKRPSPNASRIITTILSATLVATASHMGRRPSWRLPSLGGASGISPDHKVGLALRWIKSRKAISAPRRARPSSFSRSIPPSPRTLALLWRNKLAVSDAGPLLIIGEQRQLSIHATTRGQISLPSLRTVSLNQCAKVSLRRIGKIGWPVLQRQATLFLLFP